MSKALTIQLKAAFLVLVFGFNTVTGFACAIGIDMGFNKTHHHEDEATEVHADGTKHHHKEAEHKHSPKDEKDDCCNDKVVKISQADKAIPQATQLPSPVFSTIFVAVSSNVDISFLSQVNSSTKYFVLGHHPPIPDIRIAIQSFQI
jgi:hypothetical protein